MPRLKTLGTYLGSHHIQSSPGHRTMAMNIDLSDSNAWDDSALTKSWNEALKEYKAS
jgi:hypothetical protein